MPAAVETTAFGVITIVFFRRNVETGAPIFDEPQAWVYDACDVDKAREEFARLKEADHLYVPGSDLTLATHK